jgi:surface protein
MKRILVLLVTILSVIGCKEDPTMYNLTVSSNPTDGGTINPTSGEYEEGTEVNIRVSTNIHYEFDKWSGDWIGSETPLTITMDSDKNLVGNFKLLDTDGDGVTDDIDQCNSTLSGQTVDSNGCSDSQKDSDEDGVTDDLDTCPETPSGEEINETGCSSSQIDTDGDGVMDDKDTCGDTRIGVPVDENGCMLNPIYLDENGVTIKSYEWGEVGDTGEVNGVLYTIVSEEQLRSLILNENNSINVCTTKVLNMDELFQDGKTVFNISNWDVSNVTSMSKLFMGIILWETDLSFWDVSNVKDMSNMFSFQQVQIKNSGIENWDVSSVMDMSFMFYNGINFDRTPLTGFEGIVHQIDLSSWDVGNVKNMSGMFVHSYVNHDISSWNVSKVTNMSYMFSLTQLNGDISNWNVSNVTDMSYMFYGTLLNTENVFQWNLDNVINISYMFKESSIVNHDLLSEISFVKNENMEGMFMNCVWYGTLNIDFWDVSSVTNMTSMFYLDTNLLINLNTIGFKMYYPYLKNWSVSNVELCKDFFNMDDYYNPNINWYTSLPPFESCKP